MSTQQIPIAADYYGGFLAQYIQGPQGALAGHIRVIAAQNILRTENFQLKVKTWLDNAGRARDFNNGSMIGPLAIPLKPICDPLLAVQTVYVVGPLPTPAPDDKVLTVNVAADPSAALGMFAWEELLPLPVCPDLPPYQAAVSVSFGPGSSNTVSSGAPTIVTVEVMERQTDSAGHVWLRLS